MSLSAVRSISGPGRRTSGWRAVLFGAMAGGLGWGIRGQYGHETGAMIAGALVSWVVLLICAPDLGGRAGVRAAAWGTIAMGFGGSMTYGQTIGLTQNAPHVGQATAWFWGMLGLSIKGGIWIGFFGAFLGMGLGGATWRVREILILMLALIGLYFVGRWWINSPFDPSHRVLPRIYFSDDWKWEPGASLKPRPECWGGLLVGLVALVGYTGVVRKDALTWRLAAWGVLGGATGFPLGQSLQSFHAWHPEIFQRGLWVAWDPNINWWNLMETVFGATWGAALGAGAWLHRGLVREPVLNAATGASPAPGWGWSLLVAHLILLGLTEFAAVRFVDAFYDIGLILGLVPMVAVAAGGRWALWLLFPITAVPIAGKTLRQLVYHEAVLSPWLGWIAFVGLPLVVILVGVRVLQDLVDRGASSGAIARRGLLVTAWFYIGLNFAFFHFPWPWLPWTSRTPNGIVYMMFGIGLTWLCWSPGPGHGPGAGRVQIRDPIHSGQA